MSIAAPDPLGSPGVPPPPPLPVRSASTARPTLSELALEKFKNRPELLRILKEYESRAGVQATVNQNFERIEKLFETVRKNDLKRHADVSRMNRESEAAEPGGEAGRVERLKEELAALKPIDVPSEGNHVFRADGRSPWTIWLADGFAYREGGDLDLVRSGLRSIALKDAHGNLSSWMAAYRITHNSGSIPTVSTGRKAADTSGASNSRWQYAITLDLPERPLDEKALGIDYKSQRLTDNQKKEDQGDRLLMDAPTLDAASQIAITGGAIREVTFFTPIPAAKIVAYMLLTDGPRYLLNQWRPFNQQNLDKYREILIKYGEFSFSE